MKTYYTTPWPNLLTNGKVQRFLLNRVSYTTTEEGVSTIYSYDPHGNVEWLVQDILPDWYMDDPGKKQFLVEYEYDLISNKVTRLNYQPGKADQFFTTYRYDEDNRITEVRTSRDGQLWERDARYTYYPHGSLRRTEIGEDGVQGVDYVYTIQGWLKSINHPLLGTFFDPGGDGATGSETGQDAFASGLTYFNGDFKKQGSWFDGFFFTAGLYPERDLFNGNISQWTTNSKHSFAFGNTPDLKYWGMTARRFHYDELNRITQSDFRHRTGGWKDTDEYDSDYSYDANGNLLKLNRNAYKLVNGQSKMDKLGYEYDNLGGQNNYVKTNRLRRVKDTASPFAPSGYEGDLEYTRTYTYDQIGNVILDDPSQPSEPNLAMDWNLIGKVRRVSRSDGRTIDYRYDATGHRILKKVSPVDDPSDITYYVRDAQGNILSIYNLLPSPNGEEWQMVQQEVPLYGSSRVGTASPAQLAFGRNANQQDVLIAAPGGNVFTRSLGNKAYEINDHLGNVRLTVSDTKLSNIANDTPQNYRADILSGMEYYPFGSLMAKRHFGGEGLRFGFQGQEMDNEEKGLGDDIHFTFREYDSRVGRFMSIDPIIKKYPQYSPYSFSGNKLIAHKEWEGLEEVVTIIEKDNSTTIKLSDYKEFSKYKRAIDTWVHFASETPIENWKSGRENYMTVKGNDGKYWSKSQGSLTIDFTGSGGYVSYDDTKLGLSLKPLSFSDHMQTAKFVLDAYQNPENHGMEQSINGLKQVRNNVIGSALLIFGIGEVAAATTFLDFSIATVGVTDQIDNFSSNLTTNGNTFIENKYGRDVKTTTALIGIGGTIKNGVNNVPDVINLANDTKTVINNLSDENQ